MNPGFRNPRHTDDEGFMLAAVIVMVFLVLLALSVAAPSIGMQIKRERELEAQNRARQYVRAVQVFYNKNQRHYPGSIEQMDKTNNQRFLRQHYLDPLTGKNDWRLIHVGENKTKAKGLFGADLPGPEPGLGAAAGLQSSTGTATTANQTPQTPGTTPGSTATTGTSSSSSLDSLGAPGGPIIGVGSSKTGDALLVVNEKHTYQEWEFFYDPRIEALKARATLLGGPPKAGGGLGSGIQPATPAQPAPPAQTPP